MIFNEANTVEALIRDLLAGPVEYCTLMRCEIQSISSAPKASAGVMCPPRMYRASPRRYWLKRGSTGVDPAEPGDRSPA